MQMGTKTCLYNAVILCWLAVINASRWELDLENLAINENKHFRTLGVIVSCLFLINSEQVPRMSRNK